MSAQPEATARYKQTADNSSPTKRLVVKLKGLAVLPAKQLNKPASNSTQCAAVKSQLDQVPTATVATPPAVATESRRRAFKAAAVERPVTRHFKLQQSAKIRVHLKLQPNSSASAFSNRLSTLRQQRKRQNSMSEPKAQDTAVVVPSIVSTHAPVKLATPRTASCNDAMWPLEQTPFPSMPSEVPTPHSDTRTASGPATMPVPCKVQTTSQTRHAIMACEQVSPATPVQEHSSNADLGPVNPSAEAPCYASSSLVDKGSDGSSPAGAGPTRDSPRSSGPNGSCLAGRACAGNGLGGKCPAASGPAAKGPSSGPLSSNIPIGRGPALHSMQAVSKLAPESNLTHRWVSYVCAQCHNVVRYKLEQYITLLCFKYWHVHWHFELQSLKTALSSHFAMPTGISLQCLHLPKSFAVSISSC